MVSFSMEQISEALKSAKTKKQNLRKAFDFVQSHSSSFASFTLQWSDLEQHFDSLQKSLEQRFKELETTEKQLLPSKSEPPLSGFRTEMKSFCLKMDGIGLRSFIMDHRKDIPSREDVTFALQSADDPAKLVLDALQGFYPLKSRKDKGGELGAIRRTCVLLLEALTVLGPEVKPPVKEEAKKLAVDWKQKVTTESDDQLEALVFLQLLGTYGLASEFDINELLDLLVSIAKRRQAVDLYRGLGFEDKISDFIQKLSTKGKQIEAIKFIYAFEMVDKFPPVPLLNAHLEESKKVGQEVRKKGNNSTQSLNEAIAKETAYLRAIIKCIEEHKLESQLSRESIDKRIEELEKQKPEKKRPTTVVAPLPAFKPQHNQQQSGNKRLRFSGPSTADVAPSPQFHIQPTGFLRENLPSYLSSTAQYDLAGSHTFPAYLGSAAGPSGAGAAPLNGGANQSSSLSHLYSSESYLPSSLYDRSAGFGGYGLRPSYGSSPFYS